MPGKNDDVVGVRLGLDVNEFMAGANQARRTIKEINAEFRLAVSGMDDWRKSIDGVQAKITQLNSTIDAHKAYLAELEARKAKLIKDNKTETEAYRHTIEGIRRQNTEINKANVQLTKYEAILERLKAEEAEQNTALAKLNRTISEQENRLAELLVQYRNVLLTSGKYSDEANSLEAEISQLNNELRENRDILNQVNGSADQLTAMSNAMGKGFTVLRGILANVATDGFYAVIRGMKETIRTGIEWESAFMGVRRTVEGTEEQFYSLERSLISLGQSTATPLNEIANLASLAGQMGLPVDDISEFTRVMIMLGDTTNISAEEAGDSLARLSNLLNLSTDDYMRMGSVLVDLGNKFPTTESEIAAMASRLGGTANMLGITADKVFGIANAISAVGLEAEMGGNAVSKTLREMQLAVENGTDRLAIFASTAGLSVDEFVEIFSEDATKALSMFINGLGNVDDNGKSVTQTLSELNITELRQVDTLSRLATNTDTFNESLRVAEEAWKDNTALIVEANKRYSTIESRLQMMRNAWSAVAITIEDAFEPAMRGGIELLTRLARGLTDQRGASEELEGALAGLESATALYKQAQIDAKDATDGLTLAMQEQRKIDYQDAFVGFGKRLEDSQTEIQRLRNEMEGAKASIDSFFEDWFINDRFKEEDLDFLASVGFDVRNNSTDNILSMYGRRGKLQELVAETGNAGAQTLLNRINEMIMEDVVDPYNQIISGSEAEIERLEKRQKDILNKFAGGVREGDISYLDVLGRGLDEETEKLFTAIDEGYTRGMENFAAGFENITDRSSEGLNAYITELKAVQDTLDITDEGFWSLSATIDAVFAYADEKGIKLNDTLRNVANTLTNTIGDSTSAQEMIDRFAAQRKQDNYIASLLGIPVDRETVNSAIQKFVTDGVRQIDEWEAAIDTALMEGNSNRVAWLKEQIEDLQPIVEQYASLYSPEIEDKGKTPDPDEQSGNWWTNFTDSLSNDRIAKFGEGLKSMMSDLASLWDTIGGGILDTMGMWFDAQLDNLDRLEEELADKLEDYTEMVEDSQNRQENALRVSLRNNEIDEEEYYRLSAKNKYESEAKKMQAQEEYEKQMDKIQKKREEVERQQFEAEKVNSIAQVWISAAQGIAAAWSRGEPISAGIITGLISAMAATQTGIIASQQYTPALATGGIVTSPTTALIGEAGKEAVLPLEQNTDWMDELAYRIGSVITSDRIRTAIDRTMDEDGRTVDKTSTMNFTQIINSPKALSRKEIYRDTRRLVRMVDRRTS